MLFSFKENKVNHTHHIQFLSPIPRSLSFKSIKCHGRKEKNSLAKIIMKAISTQYQAQMVMHYQNSLSKMKVQIIQCWRKQPHQSEKSKKMDKFTFSPNPQLYEKTPEPNNIYHPLLIFINPMKGQKLLFSRYKKAAQLCRVLPN